MNGQTRERSASQRRGAGYKKLKTSLLAAIFTSYRPYEKKFPAVRDGLTSGVIRSVSGSISSSLTTGVLSHLASFFLSLRLKVYGTFLLTFGAYTALFGVIKNFVLSGDRLVFDILTGLILFLAALPLVSSKETLSSALLSSKVGVIVHHLTGIRYETMQTDAVRGRVNHGFLFGVAAGVASYFTSPGTLIFWLSAIVLVWVVSSSPEFGVISTAFMIPFAGYRVIFFFAVVTLVSCALKVIRRKRYLTFETLDVAVLGIALMTLFCAVTSANADTALYSVRLSVLSLSYFAAANIMRSEKWLDRAATSFVFSISLCCFAVLLFRTVGFFTSGASEDAV